MYNWLEELWRDFLPKNEVKIGDISIPVDTLNKEIKSFLYQTEQKTQTFSIDELLELLVNKQILSEDCLDEISLVSEKQENDLLDDKTNEVNDDPDDGYPFKQEREGDFKGIRCEVVEDIIQYLEKYFSHRLDIITRDLISLKKKGKPLNPQKKYFLEIEMTIRNLSIPGATKLENISIENKNGHAIITFQDELNIDEEFVNSCTDGNEHYKNILRNHWTITRPIDFFLWSLILLNIGFKQVSQTKFTYIDPNDSTVKKHFVRCLNGTENETNNKTMISLNMSQLEQIVDLMILLNRSAYRNDDRLNIAISRLISSLTREKLHDVLIDLVFSLETALLMQKEEEISHRLILYSTYIASDSMNQISEDSELIKLAYQARSNIAHGNIKKIEISVKKVDLINLFDLVRRVILTLLNLHFSERFDQTSLRKRIVGDTLDLLEIIETIYFLSKEKSLQSDELNDFLKQKQPLLFGIKKIKQLNNVDS